MPIYDDILATIGRTPIVRINNIPDEKCANLLENWKCLILPAASKIA